MGSSSPRSAANVAHQDAAASALERIRNRTREVHRDLEALPIWDAAFRDLAAYAALLDGFLSLVRPADLAVAQTLGPHAPDWFSSATRSDWLESDRRAVAGKLDRHGTELSPQDDAFISAIAERSSPAAAGTLYVLEGSALGGRIISRRLSESLGLDAEYGARYFNGHGAQTGARWSRFLDWLAGTLPATTEADAAAEAARAVFERFHARLAGLSHA